MNKQNVPADFPREGALGAVTGMQPKLLARNVDGQYVVGLTDVEVQERYATCQDLVEQLVAYCERKMLENDGRTLTAILARVRKSAVHKADEWQLSRKEVEWVLARVGSHLTGEKSQDRGFD